MMSMLCRFLADESGVTAIEYGLITILVCIPIITGITLVGNSTGIMWNKISTAMAN